MLHEYRDAVLSGLIKTPTTNRTKPYCVRVIDSFLGNLAENLITENSAPLSNGVQYNNPLEVKTTNNSWNSFKAATYSFFTALSSDDVASNLSTLTGLKNLVCDPGLHGGGVHQSTNGGKLNLHLDYSAHPATQLHRKLNLIYFCVPDWEESWGGALQFWSGFASPEKEIIRVYPKKDRLVIFEVGDQSWHGFPEPIQCPSDVVRTTLAIYYCTYDPVIEGDRKRALFVPTPSQSSDPEILSLIAERTRRKA